MFVCLFVLPNAASWRSMMKETISVYRIVLTCDRFSEFLTQWNERCCGKKILTGCVDKSYKKLGNPLTNYTPFRRGKLFLKVFCTTTVSINMADGIQEIDSNLIETNYNNIVYSFDELNLKKDILRGK